MLGFLQARKDRGDTLIEVLFAVTVFAAIVVVALSLMNQGVSASQRALEITTVRQQMDGQAETLRFLHEAYVQAYQPGMAFDRLDGIDSPAEQYHDIIEFIKAANRTSASEFDGLAACRTPNPSRDFILDPVSATLVDASTKPNVFQGAPTYAQLVYDEDNELQQSQGLWLEAVRSGTNGTNAGYIDFHIRACWEVIGSDRPMNLGTIVRLYEPRG